MRLPVECRECGAQFEVTVTFGEPMATSDIPERCHDGEPDEVDPHKCPECKCEINQEAVMDRAEEIMDKQRTERAIERDEQRKENRRYGYD